MFLKLVLYLLSPSVTEESIIDISTPLKMISEVCKKQFGLDLDQMKKFHISEQISKNLAKLPDYEKKLGKT